MLRLGLKILFCFFCLPSFGSHAVNSDSLTNKRFGASVAADLSYTGISSFIAGSLPIEKIKLTAGFKKNINKSYTPTSAPFGFIFNLAYYPEGQSQKFVTGFFNTDYKITFLKPYCPTGDCNVNYNFIHEYSLGYGFKFRVNEHLNIINNINFGRYSEVFYSEFQGKRIVFSGYNALIRIGLNYDF